MAKFETNLSNRDKVVILSVLGGAVIFMFIWYMIRPTILSINDINDDIESKSAIETVYRNKIINLTSAESVYGRVTDDLNDSTEKFYDKMRSSEIDRMMTNYVLEFGLFPEDLYISMPEGAVSESPYVYSGLSASPAATPSPTPTPVSVSGTTGSAASGLSADSSPASGSSLTGAVVSDNLFTPYNNAKSGARTTVSSGIECAAITLVVSGDEDKCQTMIDDLCVNESVRITGFEWMADDLIEVYDEETGAVEYVDPGTARLRININLYMADIDDFEVAVSGEAEG